MDEELWYPKPPVIYKCHTGQHIDLERIVSISEIEYNNSPFGFSNYCFYIYFQLMDKPLIINVDSRYPENYNVEKQPWLTDLQKEHLKKEVDSSQQNRINQYNTILNVWKRYKESQSNG